jgi:hypothetical protein
MGMVMLLREDRLRLYGGSYKENEVDVYDPDDIINDPYWKDNYQDTDEEDFLLQLAKAG